MKRILSYGISIDHNFGGPSLVLGLDAVLKEIYGENGYSLVHYQLNNPEEVNASSMPFPVKKLPYMGMQLIKSWFKYRVLRIAPRRLDEIDFWDDFRQAEIVYNIYGICFCAKLNTGLTKQKPFTGIRTALSSFALNVIAKIEGKLSVKGASSYGPIKSPLEKDAAKISARFIFDRMLARENESADQMRDIAGVRKRIPVAPDIANMMPVSSKWEEDGPVGISVSFQIIKQWDGDGNYQDMMVKLISYIHSITGRDVVIFPNELKLGDEYDDDSVALEIYRKVGDASDWLSICDTKRISGAELKNLVSKCSVVVAARYHSCVAALSSGVPVLVLGWHCKYAELLSLYGQEPRMVSTRECTLEHLENLFVDMWIKRRSIHRLLVEKSIKVKTCVVDSEKYLLGMNDNYGIG